MYRASVFATSISRTGLRRLSTTEVRCKKPDLTKIRQKQELFQQENGIPIHLKGGGGDYVLFYTSVALTLFGMGAALHSTYKLAISKKFLHQDSDTCCLTQYCRTLANTAPSELYGSKALKFFGRHGSRTLRLAPHNLIRMSSTDEPCPPRKEPCPEPPKPKDPPKTECSAPPPPSTPVPACPEPPPCPPMPPCPPTLCPPVRDPNNPCNYTPPACIDGDNPDLTKLKKLQCKFQEDNGIPVYLKGGKFDVFLYQATWVLTIIGCVGGLYSTIELILK